MREVEGSSALLRVGPKPKDNKQLRHRPVLRLFDAGFSLDDVRGQTEGIDGRG